MEERNNWRERWLNSIYELTTIDLQINSWLNQQNTNPHWSYIEFIETYFDDLSLTDSYETILKQGWVTYQEYETIKEWHEKLDKYKAPDNDDHNHKAILEDSNWIEIVELGEKSKHQLAQMVNSKEKKILTQRINIL